MRRRVFDHVDPNLAPAWQDPPEPHDEPEDEMQADLEILARELKQIAEGHMPVDDGSINPPSDLNAMLWAEGWLLSLAELGVMPAPVSSERSTE